MVLEAIRFVHRKDAGSDGKPAARLEILDQLLLPHQSHYMTVATCEDAHAAIKKMQVRGAPAIAIVAALALATELVHEATSGQLPKVAQQVADLIGTRLDYLQTSRPTAVNLGDAVGKLKKIVTKAASEPDASGTSVADAYIGAAEQMLVDDVSDNQAIGEHGSAWIEQNTVAGAQRRTDPNQRLQVLTHCNTGSLATAGYGTALGVIRSLRTKDLLTHAYCSETRPYNQGSRLTAYELVHDEIPATLITDSMAASLLAREGQDLAAIVVGADRVAANGDTANKIGTYSLAVLAKHHGVKFLVAAPRTTIDLSTPSGKGIVIEQRAADEVTKIKGPRVDSAGQVIVEEGPTTINVAAHAIDVWNPAFDITPANLIDGIITERGVVEKSDGRFDFKHLFNQS